MKATQWLRGACATVSVMAAASVSPVAAQEEVLYRFSGTEDFASIVTSGQVGDTLTRLTLLVSRGHDGGEPRAFLRYDIVKCLVPTNTCARSEAGFGVIPTTDVTGSGNSTLRVRTDTRLEANPGFVRFAGTGGIVDVTWRTTAGPLLEAEFSGVQTTGSLGLFTRSTGRRVTGNGDAEGTVLGLPARQDNYLSVISANVGTFIEMIRQN